MIRLVVHAGFHKTGTTSAQHMLGRNRAPLRKVGVQVVLRDDMRQMTEAARQELTDYGATPALMAALCEVAQATPGAFDLRLFFSTRAALAWLKSCYGQHLKSIRMRLGQDNFMERYHGSADLAGIEGAPRAALTALPPANASPPDRADLTEALLALHRSDLDQKPMWDRKHQLLREAGL